VLVFVVLYRVVQFHFLVCDQNAKV